MVDKALVFLVGFLCFTQLSISESVHFKNLKRSRRDIVDNLKESYEQFLSTVNEAFKNALNIIISLVHVLKNSAEQTLQDSSSVIEKVQNQLIKQLDALKQLAKESGVGISECTMENEAKLLALRDLTIKELSKCIKQQIDEAQTVLDKIAVDISKILDSVLEIGKEIDECGTSITSLPCLTNVNLKITKTITALPAAIATIVAEAAQFVVTRGTSAAKCATDTIVGFTQDGEKIFTEIANCIHDKLGS